MQKHIKNNNIKAILFDYDNTLADENYWIKERWKKTTEFVKTKYNYKKFSETFWELFNQNGNIIPNIVDDTLNAIGEDLSNVEEIVNYFKKTIVEEKLIEGSIECIEHFKKNNYLIGIITNGRKSTHKNRLIKANLIKYFDVVVYSYKNPKPSIEPFIYCAKKLKIKPKNMIYIGDDFNTDYLPSLKAGCVPILYDPNNKYIEKDDLNKIYQLKSLIDII